MRDYKKINRATAIKYTAGDNAPRVVASGKGLVADKIIDVAQKSNVPVYVDKECSKLLSFLEIGSEIPEELYEVVAKILVFISSVDKTYNAKK